MKMRQFPLLASSALFAMGTLGFADEVQTLKPPADSVIIQAPAPTQQPTAPPSYIYGDPKMQKDEAKGTWTALLPSKGFTIKSHWNEEPEFQLEYGPDKKAQGAVSLATVKLSLDENVAHTLHLLVNIYDPKAVDLDMSSPEQVVKELITEPAKEAEQRGFKIETTKLEGAVQKGFGVLDDVRRKISISQEGKGLQSQYYRLLIGKDFVVLGLVIGPFDGITESSKAFLDGISLEDKAAK